MLISLPLVYFFKPTFVLPNAEMVHVDWLLLSVVFLALYLASSLDQASSPNVVDADPCENFQAIHGGALLPHVSRLSKFQALFIVCVRVMMTSAANASITWSMEKFAS